MTLWYDVSDIFAWPLPHLTGIQRVVVGVLNGLCEEGAGPKLVIYDAKLGCFRHILPAEMASKIQTHLTPTATAALSAERSPPRSIDSPSAIMPIATAPKPPRKRLITWRMLFGSDAAASELRVAVRDIKAATLGLLRAMKHWILARVPIHKRSATLQAAVDQAHSKPAESFPRKMFHSDPTLSIAPFTKGDVLISIGATWSFVDHNLETVRLRTAGVRLVTMIHDLIPTIKPQWVHAEHTVDITLWARRWLAHSDHVLANSEFTKKEIETYCQDCRLDQPELSVVRFGDMVAPDTSVPAPLPRFVPTRPFFMCVSTLDVRKNHRLLYNAWQLLAEELGSDCPDLLCIGVPHLFVADLLREIRTNRSVNGHIHVLNGIGDEELDWYYQNAEATIYPSVYEGWGLPVGESLAYGKLCLASGLTSIPEIGGDLVEYFDPYNPREVVSLVKRVLTQPDWVRSREAEIRACYKPTFWSETAQQVIQVVANLPGQRGGLPAQTSLVKEHSHESRERVCA
jgi:glycosyltransferase involved in cell wall biosynthesis